MEVKKEAQKIIDKLEGYASYLHGDAEFCQGFINLLVDLEKELKKEDEWIAPCRFCGL